MSDTPQDTQGVTQELQQTRKALKEAEARLNRIYTAQRRGWRRRVRLGRWGLRFFLGKDLRRASRRWFLSLREMENPKDLSSDETADFVSALVERFVRIGVFTLILAAFAALTPLATLWQGYLISEQIKQDASDTRVIRRTHLLEILYECSGSDKPIPYTELIAISDSSTTRYAKSPNPLQAINAHRNVNNHCINSYSKRVRQDALFAFLEIERGQGGTPNLDYSNLEGLYIPFIDFSDVSLFGANLSNTQLSHSNFQGVFLSASNFHGSDLTNVDFSSAILAQSNFSFANLRGADFQDANLRGAHLAFADYGLFLERREGNKFSGALVEDANFSNAFLGGTIFNWKGDPDVDCAVTVSPNDLVNRNTGISLYLSWQDWRDEVYASKVSNDAFKELSPDEEQRH